MFCFSETETCHIVFVTSFSVCNRIEYVPSFRLSAYRFNIMGLSAYKCSIFSYRLLTQLLCFQFGLEWDIYMIGNSGMIRHVKVKDLLPYSFLPETLGEKRVLGTTDVTIA